MINTSKAINGEIRHDDWVIAVPSEEYGCLVGMVSEIVPLGSPEHDTGNETDDIHVNFMDTDYSDKRKDEIAEQMAELYGEHRPFDDLPLDDVIMCPDALIRVTGIELCTLSKIIECQNTAELFCESYIK